VNQLLEARGARFAAAVVSGILFYFTLGLTPPWLAAWLAPIPLLLAAFHASQREARLLAWLAAAIGLSSNFTYYLKTTGTVATVVLLLLQILVWGFFATRTRAAVLASRNWLIVFVYPVLLAAIDTLVSFFSPHGTWGSFVYTQMDALPVIQIASVLGAPAVAFLVGLFASTVAVALYRGLRIERPLLAYGVPLVLIAAGLGYGAVRLREAKTAPTVKIGMVAIDDFIGGSTPPERAEAVWRGYEDKWPDSPGRAPASWCCRRRLPHSRPRRPRSVNTNWRRWHSELGCIWWRACNWTAPSARTMRRGCSVPRENWLPSTTSSILSLTWRAILRRGKKRLCAPSAARLLGWRFAAT
jgi:hypothetical protein